LKIFIKDHDVGGLLSRHRVTVGFLAAIAVLATVVFIIVDRQSQNRRAIEKGCILLNNAIIQSQAGASKGPTAILVKEILRNAAEDGRQYVVQNYTEAVKKNPTVIPIINCKAVAKHPDVIKALPLKPSQPKRPPARVKYKQMG
jgi:hypothetical protein